MELNQGILDTINEKFYDAEFDSYLIENHEYLFNLFNLVDSYTNWKDYVGMLPLKRRVSGLKTLLLESEFLASFSLDYKNKLWKDFFLRCLVRVDGLGIDDGVYKRNLEDLKYKIRYPKNNNIGDPLVLVHEYIHHLSSFFPDIIKDTLSYTVYCEVLSILGQLMFLDFLKMKGYALEELQSYKCYMRQIYQNNLNSFLFAEPILDIHIGGGILTKDNLIELLNENEYYKIIGEKGVMNNLKFMTADKIETCLSYSHPLGMIFGSSLYIDGISNQDFVELMNAINRVELKEFESMLPSKSLEELARDTASVFDFTKKIC